MKKIKTVVTYRVPEWDMCNHIGPGGEPSKDTCRFCVKTKSGHTCAIYNETLSSNGIEIMKTNKCIKATAMSKDTVEDDVTQDLGAAVRIVKKDAIDSYHKIYTQLIKEGLSESAADKLARQLIMKG